MKRCTIVILLLLVTRAIAEPVTFDDAYWLRDARVQLAVSPKAGRIVWFGARDGNNKLFIPSAEQLTHPNCAPGKQPYYPRGGDKLWPAFQGYWPAAQQSSIPWPPDPALDGQAWTLIAHEDRTLTIQSSVSKAYGIQATRTIHLSDVSGQVDITNRIMRVVANPFPVMCWSVTQVCASDDMLLDASRHVGDQPVWISMKPQFPIITGVQTYLNDTVVRWARTDATSLHSKIGTLGTWIMAQWPHTALLQWTNFDPKGAYPDASNVQSMQNGAFTEMELLSPSVQLHVGQTLTQISHWQLLKVDADTPVAKIVQQIHCIIAQHGGRS